MAEENESGSFVRWQGITLTQLGYAVNLILGLAVAALGFLVSLLLKVDFIPVSWQKCAFFLALVSLLASVGFGMWVVVNRLRDFRVTKDIARRREKNKKDKKLPTLRDFSERLGKRTWWLFWWQIGTFGVGVLVLVVGVAASIKDKLL